MTMADYKETHEITTDSGGSKNSSTPWLAFLVGGLLIAVIAIFFINSQGTIDGPGGQAEFNVKSPVTIETPSVNPAPAEPAPAK
jgi:hypothetical protein